MNMKSIKFTVLLAITFIVLFTGSLIFWSIRSSTSGAIPISVVLLALVINLAVSTLVAFVLWLVTKRKGSYIKTLNTVFCTILALFVLCVIISSVSYFAA